MPIRLNASDGSYATSYFFMKIETHDDLESLLSNHDQTFVHEYIHFLQDLLLSYNIRINIGQIHRFNLVASMASSEGIIRPFNQWGIDAELVEHQVADTWGQIRHLEGDELTIERIDSTSWVVPATGARVFKHTATLSSGEPYVIGANDMLEYIAHKIESKHWQTSAPAFPYRTIDKVLDHLNLSEMPDDCRIALVEFCLHNDHPFNQLMVALNTIFVGEHRNLLLDSERIDSVLEGITWHPNGVPSETISTKSSRRLNQLIEELRKRYRENNFESVALWVEDVTNVIKRDFHGALFFSKLYRLDELEFKTKISDILKTFGMPLVFNQSDEAVSILPEKYEPSQFFQFYAAQKLLEFVSHTGNTCPLISVCEARNPDLIDDNCYNNAIARGLDEYLCPFGQLIRTYDLHRIE